MSSTTTAKGLAEFIGTLFLTLTIFTAAVAGSAGSFAPVAIGMMLMVMVCVYYFAFYSSLSSFFEG